VRKTKEKLLFRDVEKARRKLFVRYEALGMSVQEACDRSGFTSSEAKAFKRSEEYLKMMQYFWDRYLKVSFKSGSRKLFSTTVTALSELSELVQDGSPEIKLRAIAELRQWLSDQRNPILKKISEQIVEAGEKQEDSEVLGQESSQRAKEFLSALRRERQNGKSNNGKNNGVYRH